MASISLEDLVNSLNPEQRRSVTHPPDVPLQILAGPGSGKTKVLTSRIAHLILHHHLPPHSICAVTFTNKAANEMRVRLEKLIGKERTSRVKMGTFHALCAAFLRRYGPSGHDEDDDEDTGDVQKNFTVCDASESQKIIRALLKDHQEQIAETGCTLTDRILSSMISRAKSRGQSPKDLLSALPRPTNNGAYAYPNGVSSATVERDRLVAKIYEDYDAELRRSNCLDFDDLLLYGVRLFKTNKKAREWCRHVLVDEFQDTNTVQYRLMLAIASTSRCVTIVGDPDQSIYGWRSAEVENLGRMYTDFPNAEQILLEQNYRSTGAILNTSVAIISQDTSRIAKTLRTTHPSGVIPSLLGVGNEKDEAEVVAWEIKRVVAYMGGAMNYSDFAVLLRTNALSRTFESTFQKEGIPCRVLKGHKFFERLEVKDLLAYLQLVDNPAYDPAFKRAVNTPSRGIGEKTIAQIVARANTRKCSPYTVVQQICASKIPDVKPPIKKKLAPFVKIVETLGTHAAEGVSAADLTRKLTELLDYHHHLRSTQPDWEARWENVQELITFASEFESTAAEVSDRSTLGDEGAWGGPETDETEADGTTPLRSFLQASMLSSDGDNESEADGSTKEKVTLSTCHAAKGLEWPVVFVPAVEEKMFPLDRSEDIEEERRLLYVACTRAQGLLYLTHTGKRKIAAETMDRKLSVFVSKIIDKNEGIFSPSLPDFTKSNHRSEICRIIGRHEPDPNEASKMLLEHNFLRATHQPQAVSQNWSSRSPWGVTDAQHAVPCNGFESSRVVHQSGVASSSQAAPRAPAISSSGFFSSSRMLNNTGSGLKAERRATPGMAQAADSLSRAGDKQPESRKKPSQPTLSLESWRQPRDIKSNGGPTVPGRPGTTSTHPIASATTKEASRAKQVASSRLAQFAASPATPQHASYASSSGSAANPIDLGSPSPSRPPLKTQMQATETSATSALQDSVVPAKRRLGMSGRTTGYVNKKFKVVQKPT